MNHIRLPFTDDLNIVRLTCLHSVWITNSEIGRMHTEKISHLKFKIFERIPSGVMPFVQVMAKCECEINDVMV